MYNKNHYDKNFINRVKIYNFINSDKNKVLEFF